MSEPSGRQDAANRVQDLKDRNVAALEEIERLRREIAQRETEINKLETKLANAEPLPAEADVAALRRHYNEGMAINRLLGQRDQRNALISQAQVHEKKSLELTQAMERREHEKEEAIRAAKMPVDGLGFGDGCVTFNGVPFDQASTAEQLKASVAIAMAANPKLRVILIKEGSLLDADSLELIATMAREHDYQVWIEAVDTSGKVGIFIEDGSVVAVDGERVGDAA